MQLSESATSMRVNVVLGFLLGDKKAGPFNLNFDWIKVKKTE